MVVGSSKVKRVMNSKAVEPIINLMARADCVWDGHKFLPMDYGRMESSMVEVSSKPNKATIIMEISRMGSLLVKRILLN